MEIPAKHTRAELRAAVSRIRAEALKLRATGKNATAQRLEKTVRKMFEESGKRPDKPVRG